MQARNDDYPRLWVATLHSIYSGAITLMVSHRNKRRFCLWQAPPMVITVVTSFSVYLGSASRHHRDQPGSNIHVDDQIYWSPVIAMHTGMSVTEIGL